MEDHEKLAIINLFDKKYSFTDEEIFYLENALKTTPNEYMEQLLISAQTPYREKIDLDDCKGVFIKPYRLRRLINFILRIP